MVSCVLGNVLFNVQSGTDLKCWLYWFRVGNGLAFPFAWSEFVCLLFKWEIVWKIYIRWSEKWFLKSKPIHVNPISTSALHIRAPTIAPISFFGLNIMMGQLYCQVVSVANLSMIFVISGLASNRSHKGEIYKKIPTTLKPNRVNQNNEIITEIADNACKVKFIKIYLGKNYCL